MYDSKAIQEIKDMIPVLKVLEFSLEKHKLTQKRGKNKNSWRKLSSSICYLLGMFTSNTHHITTKCVVHSFIHLNDAGMPKVKALAKEQVQIQIQV